MHVHDPSRPPVVALACERHHRRRAEQGAMVLPMAGLTLLLLSLCVALAGLLGATGTADQLARRAAEAAAGAAGAGAGAEPCAAARESLGDEGLLGFCASDGEHVVVGVVPAGSAATATATFARARLEDS